jgi:hypothetical protein
MESTGSRLMNYASVGSALLILSFAYLSGCAVSSSVKSAWQGPAPHPSFSRVLIVGVSTDFTQRCAFEFSMASQFSGSSTDALVSCNVMMPKEPLTRENIERVIAAQHADAVLTTAVVTMQFSEQQNGVMPYYQVTGVGYVTGALGAYGVPVAFVQLESIPTIPTVTGEIHLLTKLFNTKDATMVYTLDTQAKSDNLQSDSVATDTITGLIADRLRRDGVIH